MLLLAKGSRRRRDDWALSRAFCQDEWLRRLATLPLMHQPGERWMYNTGSYVLGVLIARASGQTLETFLREHIFEPLGMHDTAFGRAAGEARAPGDQLLGQL